MKIRGRKVGRVLAEFLLIVVGVLTALAVDQFRMSRADRGQERLYLEGLVHDLARTEESVRGSADWYARILGHGERALPVLRGEEPVPVDTISFLWSVYQASRSVEPGLSRATYDDLLNTGGLRLIRADSVRLAVVNYFHVAERLLWPSDFDRDRQPYRTAVRGLLPLSVQLATRAARPCLLGADVDPCRSEFSGIALAPVVRSVLARRELPHELTLSMQSMAIRNLAGVEERTRELRIKLEQKLVDR